MAKEKNDRFIWTERLTYQGRPQHRLHFKIANAVHWVPLSPELAVHLDEQFLSKTNTEIQKRRLVTIDALVRAAFLAGKRYGAYEAKRSDSGSADALPQDG